jgi:hypothetical protein
LFLNLWKINIFFVFEFMKGKYIKGKYILCLFLNLWKINIFFVCFYHKVNLSNVNILWSFFTALCAKGPKVGSCLFKNPWGTCSRPP